MPFDPQRYRSYPPRPEREGSRARPLNDDDKMGLLLLVVAIIAFGGYTLLVFTGILGWPS